MITLDTATFESPIGVIAITVRDGHLCTLHFDDRRSGEISWLERRFGAVILRPAPNPAGIITSLSAYFGGDLTALEHIEVDGGGTPFQARVWSELRKVPVGRTISYGDLAAAVGLPHAARAVGAANARNPISLVVPCHRAIGADRRLVGYGGGLDRKRWLLQHEGALRGEASELKLPLAG